MRNVFAVFFLLSLQVLWAQSPTAAGKPGLADTQLDRRYQETVMERWALEPKDKQFAGRKEADARVLDFYRKAQHFVVLWQSFARQSNNGKTFNAKLAKQVSKAFHDLEKSDGWPVGRSQ